MSEQPIGPILDGLGVTIDLADGDLIESALVIAKVINAAGDTHVGLYDSAGMDWLAQLGLITAAAQIVNGNAYAHPDDD